MKLISSIITLLIIFGTQSFLLAQNQVAVYVSGDQEETLKKVFGSKLVSFITESQDFKAVERTNDFLNSLNAEHDYQVSGEVSNSQIVKLGQQFGARYVAVADISEIFGELFISARLIDVLTSAIESSYETSGPANNMSSLTSLANNVADGLILGPIRKKQEAAQAEKERQKQIEANKRAQLRQQAINNLMPQNSFILGNLIILRNPIQCELYLDSENKLQIKFNIPHGFRIADALIYKDIARAYGTYVSDLPKGYYLTSMFEPHPDTSRKFKYNTNEGAWTVSCLQKYSYGNDFYTPHYPIAYTKKINGQLKIERSEKIYIIVCRDYFSEAEIQAEMNRISK